MTPYSGSSKSIEPLLNDGDEILVDLSPQPYRDGIHVVRMGDTLMVKRVASAGGGRFSLLSQNLAYPPVSMAAEDIEIIGRVVWKGGGFNFLTYLATRLSLSRDRCFTLFLRR